MVTEHEATFVAAAPSSSSNSHPARGEGCLRGTEPAHPGGAMSRWWSQDQASGKGVLARNGAHRPARRHGDSGCSVAAGHGFHGTVKQHFVFNADGMQLRHQPLGLAEGVAEQQRGMLLITFPPRSDLFSNTFPRLPGVDRQSEGGLGDQHIARHHFERFTARIGTAFVIAGHHPHLAFHPQSDLGRAEHMPGAVKRHAGLVEPELLAVRHRMECDLTSQPLSQHAFRGFNCPVFVAPRSGVISVGMRDQCTPDRSGGIDPGIRSSAIETAVGVFK